MICQLNAELNDQKKLEDELTNQINVACTQVAQLEVAMKAHGMRFRRLLTVKNKLEDYKCVVVERSRFIVKGI